MATTKAAAFRAIAQARRSAKRFQTDRTIPRETLEDILHSTIRSPSGFNLQPTQIIMVHCPKIKNQLSEEAMMGPGNQFRVRDASTVAVFLSDLEANRRIERVVELERKSGARHPNYLGQMPLASSFLLGQGHAATFLKNVATDVMSELQLQPMPIVEPVHAWSYKNTALAIQSYVLAAASHELGTAILEGFDGRRMAEILRIPDRYAIPAVVPTGYEYEAEEVKRTPRLDLDEIVFGESFGQPWTFDGEEEDDDDKTAA